MVFERIYTADYLREHPYMGFLVGFSFTVIATFIAMTVFSTDPAMVIVGLVSILLLPALSQLSLAEEVMESQALGFSFRGMWSFNKSFVWLYVSIFFGVFLAFALFSLFLPSLAAGHLFKQQIAVLSLTGHAFTPGLFLQIFLNNIKVMLLAFLLSLIAGNGSIFVIVWNASVWGTVFGVLAKTAAIKLAASGPIIFILVLFSVLPHTFLEAVAYILSVISGSVISDGVSRESFFSDPMNRLLIYNLVLLGIAFAVVLTAGIVETYVLDNFKVYTLIQQFGYG